MEIIRTVWDKNKKQLSFALIAVFLWGMMAHAYCFFDNSFSHDSLNELHGAIVGNDIKVGSGRFVVPLYRDLLRSDVTLPWLIGVLSLIWIGLAVFLVIRMFRVQSRAVGFLIAGVFSVNITVSALAATYLQDLDGDMFGMLCAVAAVYLWREYRWGALPGAVLVAVSMGIYQSFVCTAAVLAMMLCIFDLLEGISFQTVFHRGMKAIGMILLGGICYFVMLKAAQMVTGIALTSGDYNSLDLMTELTPGLLVELVAGAYGDWFSRFFNAYSSYPGILVKGMSAVLLAVIALGLAVGLKKLGWKERLLLIALAALLPLAMNLIYVLMLGATHDLMGYAIWLTWLLALLMAQWLTKQGKSWLLQWQKPLCLLMAVGLLYGSVQFANGMYLKKDLEYDAYLSMMTRVVDKMEGFEGYVPGETPVVFVGMPQVLNQTMPGFLDYWNVTGMISSNVIFSPEPSRFQAYFDYVLGVPLRIAEGGLWTQINQSEEAAQMPSYPQSGFIQLRDGVLIVKLGDVVD